MQAHGEDLRAITGDDALVEQVKRNYTTASLDPQTRALLDFAVLVTRSARRVTPQHLDALRAQGLDDGDILDAVQIVGFFNYYNRLCDALGVEDEPEWAPRRGGGGRRRR